MRFLRSVLQNIEDFGAIYLLGLLPISDGFGQGKVFENFGEDLVQEPALLMQRLGQRFFERLFQCFFVWTRLCHSPMIPRSVWLDAGDETLVVEALHV